MTFPSSPFPIVMSLFKRSVVSTASMIVFLVAFACHPSNYMFEQFAQEEKGWILLDEMKVNHLGEKDIIKVQGNNKFTALRIYVRDRDVYINDLEIHLINGDVLKPAIEKEVKRGERSSVIELSADGRLLDYITIEYNSKGAMFTKRGTVLIVARNYNPNGAY